MKKIILFVFILFTIPVCSQIKFQRTFGTTAFDGGTAHPTNDGGYIVSFGSDTGSYPPWSPKGYILKTDSLLNTIWLKTYEMPNYTNSVGTLMQNPDSSYFLNASYDSNSTRYDCLIKIKSNGDTLWAKREISANAIYAQTDGGYTIHQGATLIRTDSNLNPLWQRYYKGFYSIKPAQQTNDGGYIIPGGTYTGPNQIDDAFYIVKTDSLGAVQWSKTYGLSNGYEIDGLGEQVIQQTFDGGYIFIGSSDTSGQWFYNILVMKLDASGNIQWTKTYGGGAVGGGAGVSIRQVAGAIGYIFTARTKGIESAQNGTRTMMGRINGTGNMMWGKMYGSVVSNPYLDDLADNIEIVNDGGFIFSGQTESMGAGWYDGWIVKTDANGVSGCNEMSTFPYTTVPPLIVGTGWGDSILTPVPFMPCGSLIIGTYQRQDSLLCPLPSNPEVNEINLENMIALYPNPTNGAFQITSGELRVTNIEVINVLGEQIQKLAIGSKQLATNSPTIDLSSQPEGIYFVRVDTEKGIVSKKVVVLR